MKQDSLNLVRMITWLPVGGIERRIVATLPKLREKGWNPRVLCLREEGELADDLRKNGIPVDVIPLKSRLSPPGIYKISKYLKKHATTVVHTHMYRANIPGTLAARLAGVPAIFGHIHNVNSWNSSRQSFVDKLVSPLRSKTFTVSRAVQKDVIQTLGKSTDAFPVLYNGVDIDKFYPSPELREKTRAELGLSDEVCFLVPARLHAQKNPNGVIEAFSQSLSQLPPHLAEKTVLVFAGEGKERENMEKSILQKNLQSSVRLLGSRSDMPSLYNACDCMILSSFKEGFSNAIVEALATGTPVIASDVGGNAEAIGTDRTVGWIHPSGDADKLSDQIQYVVQEGSKLLSSMSQACRERAEAFSLDNMVTQTDQFYRSALQRNV